MGSSEGRFPGWVSRLILPLVLTLLGACAPAPVATPTPARAERPATPYYTPFLQLLSDDATAFARAANQIRRDWQPNHTVLLLEAGLLTRNRQQAADILALLKELTGRDYAKVDRWFEYVWAELEPPPPGYAQYKGALYRRIDPSFESYFDDSPAASIRLDEVRWGGVQRDGIPPLENPRLITAREASYLAPGDVVFGLEHRGEARAYPKRILGWHEMVRDRVGGQNLNGVYCTLCGSMVVYKEGPYHLGTSGFLYRSNKLMYDHKTRSLWSTLEGRPVVGPLVDQGIQLERLPVVTTTWARWRELHPNTRVLSTDTGYRRDYREGAAYKDYFATDELMFSVPKSDPRLKNKAEVLALQHKGERVALSAEYLHARPTTYQELAGTRLVILTDTTGANRVYKAGKVNFETYSKDRLVDSSGKRWRLTEEALLGPGGARLPRFPAHRAFWFGWQAAFPDTRLVK